jgi:hypothetical protein
VIVEQMQRRPYLLPCGIIAGILLIIVGCFGITTYVSSVLTEETWYVPGNASHFDPVQVYPDVQAYAGEGAQLLKMEAYYVRSDGTLDLNADYSPSPSVTYRFFRPSTREAENKAPLGVPGAASNPSGQAYEPVIVKLSRPYQMYNVRSSSGEYSYMNFGMDRDVGVPASGNPGTLLEAPACSFADLWAMAIDVAEAPPEAVAVIIYDQSGYLFEIYNTNIDLQFGMDCQLVTES